MTENKLEVILEINEICESSKKIFSSSNPVNALLQKINSYYSLFKNNVKSGF
jgi:hypothetical protein